MAVQPGFGILVRQPGGDGSPVTTAKEIAMPKITALLAGRFHRGPVSFGFHDAPLPGNPPADKAAAQGGSWMARTERQDEEFAALRTALAEKERVLEDRGRLVEELLLHVKDNSRMILSLLALQTDRVADTESRREVGELAARALAIVHERLDRSKVTAVDLAAYLRELCDQLFCFHVNLGIELALAVEADAVTVAAGDAVTLGLIVNELVANSAEHTFPGGRGEVRVELRRDEAGGVRLTVADNGCGTAEERRGGLGLRLAEALAAHLGAEVAIHSSRQGTRVAITFTPREQ